MTNPARALVALSVLALSLAHSARADDGMWLLNNPPLAGLKERYGFEPTAAWLEHVGRLDIHW